MDRCGRPRTPTPKNDRVKGSRDLRVTINPAPPHVFQEAETFERSCLNSGSACFLFHHLGPAFLSVTLTQGGGESKKTHSVLQGLRKLNLTQQDLIL